MKVKILIISLFSILNIHSQSIFTTKGESINYRINSKTSTTETSQKLDSILNLSIDGTTIHSKQVYNYDSSNNLLREYKYIHNFGGEIWYPLLGNDYQYNNENYLTQKIFSEHNIPEYKYEYIYDTSDILNQEIKYLWNGSVCVFFLDSYYNYNNGLLSNKVVFSWDSNSSNWNLSTKHFYSYNANNYLTEHVIKTWNESTNDWINQEKKIYEYDATNNLILFLQYEWDDTSWSNFLKSEYIFDVNDNIESLIQYEWNNSNDYWHPTFKAYDFIHDNSISITNIEYPYYIPTGHKLNQYTAYYWDNNSMEWIPDYDAMFYYNPTENLSNQNQPLERPYIFPNPTSDIAFISGLELNDSVFIEIFDNMGRKIIKQKINNQRIRTAEFNAGLYLYILYYNNKSVIGKLIII
ncbi:MAG TPA: T9SS type A sorting domain-containing protein [Saprospiraceae bacterium]|nr:T9SS type A sorting domain-containing protein [Saprospiraceae bacterium]